MEPPLQVLRRLSGEEAWIGKFVKETDSSPVASTGNCALFDAFPRTDRLVVASLAERVAEPFETFVETITRGSAGGLDVLVAC